MHAGLPKAIAQSISLMTVYFVRSLQLDSTLPSRATLSRDIPMLFKECQQHIGKILQVARFSLRFCCFYTVHLRHTLGVSTLPLMLGHPQTTVRSWLGQSTLSTREKPSVSCSMSLKFQRYNIFIKLHPQQAVSTVHTSIPVSWIMDAT